MGINLKMIIVCILCVANIINFFLLFFETSSMRSNVYFINFSDMHIYYLFK